MNIIREMYIKIYMYTTTYNYIFKTNTNCCLLKV